MVLIQLHRGEVVGDDLALIPPGGVHLLEGEVVALGEQVSDVAGGPVREDAPLLDEERVDGLAVTQDDDAGRADLE